MTRRADRRRLAILGAIVEGGPQTQHQLGGRVVRHGLLLYADLVALSGAGRVIGEWVQLAGNPSQKFIYRLPDPDERCLWLEQARALRTSEEQR